MESDLRTWRTSLSSGVMARVQGAEAGVAGAGWK